MLDCIARAELCKIITSDQSFLLTLLNGQIAVYAYVRARYDTEVDYDSMVSRLPQD